MAINLKHDQKTAKLQMSNVTVSNLAIIFKLDSTRPIFICEELDGECILPNAHGEFDILSLVEGATYIVEGECQAAQVPFTSARRTAVPPPAVRPSFNFNRSQQSANTSTSTLASNVPPKTWRKTIPFCEIQEGKPSPIYQVYLTLSDETATLEKVKEMVAQEVGTSVMLIDNKNLEIRPSNATKGAFWQGCRKILAVPSGSFRPSASNKRNSTDTSGDTDIVAELKKMREDLNNMKEAGHKSESRIKGKEDDIKGFIENVFRCNICYSVTMLPVAACVNCQNIIGCVPCVEQWRESGGPMCPLCRDESEYATVPVIKGINEIIHDIATQPTHGQPTATNTSLTTS